MSNYKFQKGDKVKISNLLFTVDNLYKMGNNTMITSKEGYGDFNADLVKIDYTIPIQIYNFNLTDEENKLSNYCLHNLSAYLESVKESEIFQEFL